MTIVKLVVLSPNMDANVMRDLTKLQIELGPFSVHSDIPEGYGAVVRVLNIPIESGEPDLTIHYTDKPFNSTYKSQNAENGVFRDFSQVSYSPEMTVNNSGHYLAPQGSDGPNLTQSLLNRAHPKGRGIADPFTSGMFG